MYRILREVLVDLDDCTLHDNLQLDLEDQVGIETKEVLDHEYWIELQSLEDDIINSIDEDLGIKDILI